MLLDELLLKERQIILFDKYFIMKRACKIKKEELKQILIELDNNFPNKMFNSYIQFEDLYLNYDNYLKFVNQLEWFLVKQNKNYYYNIYFDKTKRSQWINDFFYKINNSKQGKEVKLITSYFYGI